MAKFFLFLKITPSRKRKVSEASVLIPGTSVSSRSPQFFVNTCKFASAFRVKIHSKWRLKLRHGLCPLSELEMKRRSDKISQADF